METKNNLKILKFGDITLICDINNDICFSVSSKYYSNSSQGDLDNIIDNILKQKKAINTTVSDKIHTINTVYLFITESCNLSCEFCSMRPDKKDKKMCYSLSLESIENKIIPFILELKPRRIIISGGEPLLHNNVKAIIKVLKNRIDTRITLQTNGTLLNRHLINQIKEDIFSIEISADHFQDDFYKLDDFMQYLKNTNILPSLSFVYNNNIERLFQVIDLSAKYDLEMVLNFVVPTGSALDNKLKILDSNEILDVYLKIAQYILENNYCDKSVTNIFFQNISIHKPCGAYGKNLSIYPDGHIYICHSLNYPQFCIGNLLESNNNSEIFTKWGKLLKQQYTINMLDINKNCRCKKCKFIYICNGIFGVDTYHNIYRDCLYRKAKLIFNILYNINGYSTKNKIQKFITFCNNKEYLEYIN